MRQKSAASDGQRPNFDTLLERLRNGEAQGLIVAHIDRISRNLIESGQITKFFKLGLLKELRTPSKIYSSIEDMLYLEIEFVMAADFSRRLGKRVIEGRQTKLLRGEFPGIAPLGYINKDLKIFPDPKRFSFLKKAFGMYSTGDYSLGQLCSWLYESGFRTRLKNIPIRVNVLHRLLGNHFYYGVIFDKGIFYKGVHKPMISKNLFDKVQEVLHGRNVSKPPSLNFIYRGFLKCSVCGCSLTASQKKGRYIYYYCTNGRGSCSQHLRYLSEARVEDLFRSVTIDLSLDEGLVNLSFEAYKNELVEGQALKVDEPQHLKSDLARVQSKLNSLLDLFLDKAINQEQYEEKHKELLNQKTDIEIQLRNNKPINIDSTLELLEKFKDSACRLSEMFEKGDVLFVLIY